jgi:ABC-type Fe3+-siderophore transport system permease subunit
MKNSIIKWALFVALAVLTLLVFLKILRFLLFLIATGALVFLLYALFEVNRGRKTVPEIKALARTKIHYVIDYISNLLKA